MPCVDDLRGQGQVLIGWFKAQITCVNAKVHDIELSQGVKIFNEGVYQMSNEKRHPVALSIGIGPLKRCQDVSQAEELVSKGA